MGKKADDQTTNEDDLAVDLNAGQGAEGETGEENLNGGTEGQDQEHQEGAGEDDVVVTIGEEPPPSEADEVARAPEWVRELRKTNRADKQRIKELEDKLAATSGMENKPVTLGKKPTLEDHDYDAEKYETALTSWYDQKRKIEEQEREANAQREAEQKAWQTKLDSYGKAKTELKVKDFEDAEIAAQESLSVTQQGIVLQGAENPALLIYALGKNPKKVKELASINDPVKFAFAVAKLETQLKVTNRKAAPPPERTVRGTGPTSGAVDSQLERLRADAEKTGDFTKVIAYKRQKRQA